MTKCKLECLVTALDSFENVDNTDPAVSIAAQTTRDKI